MERAIPRLIADYRQRALSLREKAKKMTHDVARQALLEAAGHWDDLADRVEREQSFARF